MNEAAAREVTLLQAFETAEPPSPSWGEDDRAWANRVAVEAAGEGAPAAVFVAQRARHALERLAPRERIATRWLARPLWRGGWLAVAAVVAFLAGLVADSIGPAQRINLLAPPLWGVLLWNAVVYFVLVGSGLAALVRRRPATPGPIVRAMQALQRIGLRPPASGTSVAVLARFAQLWSVRAAPLAIRRAESVLHAAAAALGLGLIAGLYARGLVLDYRAAWESTFLSADVAHALVGAVLLPASRLSGIGLPDAAAFAALQAAHADPSAGAPAAPWIHLFALTLLLVVVLPRVALALGCAALARLRSGRFALPLAEPYFQRLLQLQRGGSAQVQAWPYAHAPSPQAVLGLRTALASVFGGRLGLEIAPGVAFGAEDDAPPRPAATTSHGVAWFELGATPEAESQGRFVRALVAAMPAGASVIVLVDEAAFKRRFASTPERVAQRRAAWREFGLRLGSPPVFADLEAADPVAAEAALQAALAAPVQARSGAEEAR